MFRRRVLLVSLKVVDLLIVAAVIYLSIRISRCELSTLWPDTLISTLTRNYQISSFLVFTLCLYAWYKSFQHLGLYHSRRLSTLNNEIVDVVKASILGSLTISLIIMISSQGGINLQFVALLCLLSTLITVLCRLVMRRVLAQLRRLGRNRRKILIVGTNKYAIEFSRKIAYGLELGYDLLGFVDTPDGLKYHEQGAAVDTLCSLDELPVFLCEHEVDEVAIFYPLRSHYDQICNVVSICEQHGILVRIRSNIVELTLGSSVIDHVMGEPLITIFTGNMTNRGSTLVLKRVLDFYLSLIMLTLLLPLMLLVAVMIKLDSKGPVFFRQTRVGLNKKRFKIFKFRTMTVDAESRLAELEYLNEVSGAAFKIKEDPRVTKLGNWLRKTSIDELPQLFNVVRGEMSLVGPRPLPERDYNAFETVWHRRRFSVKPGITCLWQVSGRSDVSFDEWMQLDMEYIDNWSQRMDFLILLKTIQTVLSGRGAY